MKTKLGFTDIISLKLPLLQRCLLLCVDFFKKGDTYCDSSNKEFAELLDRHPTKIATAISSLVEQNFLIRTTLNGKRVLALTEIANPLIIKNNKINNSYYSFNINKSISIKECEEVGTKLINHFLKWDSNMVSNCILERSIDHPGLKLIKTAEQFRVIIHSILNGGIKDEVLFEALEFDYDLSLIKMQNTLKKICGYEPTEVSEHIDEMVLGRQENERQLRKHIRTCYLEKAIDISKNPDQLQQPFKGKKFVSITGSVVHVYEAGHPPFCNIKITNDDTGQSVYASIQSIHYKGLKAALDDYRGLIKITGQVFTSKFHKERYDVQHIIKSIEELEPIEFLKRSNLVNTRLR